MAYVFGDSFDLVAAAADLVAGYWDTNGSLAGYSLVAGRFTGGQAIQMSGVISNAQSLAKTSSVTTDPVHHIVLAFRQTAVLSGTTLGAYFSLYDGVTAQCSVVFRSDGAILLTSGGPTGTVLDTYIGAVNLQNQWFAFEVEIVINSASGSWAVRRNGNTSNDHALGSLNTRPGTNTQANKLQVGMNTTVTAQAFDDLLWRSDASSVAWVGDIRTYVRMPASDVSVQFSRSSSSGGVQTIPGGGANTGVVTNTAYYVQYTPNYSGQLSAATVVAAVGSSNNAKVAIFDATGPSGGPGAVLGTSASINPVATGTNTFTFSTPVTVIRGTPIWLGVSSDSTTATWGRSSATFTAGIGTVTYAAFPTANPTLSTGPSAAQAINSSITISPNTNYTMVAETQQDGATSYVYDNNVGDADFYSIAPIAVTPASVVAVTTRGFIQKSDAGSRSGGVQLRSGSTVVTNYTSWNPSDQTGVTLSGSNLTATNNGGANGAVRSVNSFSSGKYYWEVTTNAGSTQCGVGIANAAAVLANFYNNSAVGGSYLYNSSISPVYLNGSSAGINLGSQISTSGGILCIALDVTNSLLWYRIAPSGNWNGSGTANPATGTGGINVSAVVGPGNPAFAIVCYSTGAGSAVTANFGASAFSGAVPSGFQPFLGSSTTGSVVSATGVLSTTWAWQWRTDTVDPATSAAWTPTAVNNVNVGPIVSA